MSLPELFIKKQGSVQKEASYRLGTDVSSWEQDVMEKLYEEHPYLPDYDVKVNLRKTDEQTGAGVGQIIVDEVIRIPVIIDSYKLQPLDLMYYGGKLLPITKTSLDNITHSSSMGKAVKPMPIAGDMGLRAATRAPHYGKYAYASASLDYTADELSSSLASAYGDTVDFTLDVKDSAVMTDVIRRYARNVGMPKEAAAEPKVALNLVTQQLASDVEEGAVQTEKGLGCMYKMASFDGDFLDSRLYVGLDGAYCRTTSVAGVPAQIKLAEHTQKGYGTFVAEISGQSICLEPFEVLYKTATDMDIRTDSGERLTIQQGDAFRGIAKLASRVYLSPVWRFVPMTSRTTFTPSDILNKTAAVAAEVVLHNSRGVYWVTNDVGHPQLQKLAESPMTRSEAHVALMEFCDPTEAIKIAERVGVAYFTVDEPEVEEQIDYNVSDENKQLFVKAAAQFTDHVVKEAMEDPLDADKTVDVLLGLNFLNPQNVYRMLESIDDLEAARGILSRLLMAGRLGLKVDTGTIRSALFALDSVIKDLRRLREVELMQT